MPDSISLVKANPLLPAEDYVALRKQGFKAIERLGSALWTDYNNSDPGITILDALCYAITDLAYRTGFEVKDLLAPEKLTPDTWRQVFYTARHILHNGPLTQDDYRKLIIDVQGVRNAWIEPSKDYEVPLWIDFHHWEMREDSDCACGDDGGNVCRGHLQIEPPADFTSKRAKAERDAFVAQAEQRRLALKEHRERLQALAAKYDEGSSARRRLEAKAEAIAAKELALARLVAQIETEIEGAADTPAGGAGKIVELEGLYTVMVEYEEDVIDEDRREEVRRRVVSRLFRHRNLCEDFLSIEAIEYVDVGVGASIELEEYADPDEVLAQIFFILYRYFTPSIRFYTIEQMLEKGRSMDEIFEGPALSHGFIDSVELERTDLFRDIRLSDVINEIVDIPGVKGLLYFHLPFAGFGDPAWDQNYFNIWIAELRQARKLARVQPTKSQVVFCKQREVITYYTERPEDRRPERMLKLFRDKKALERKYKLQGQADDLPVPVGEYMALEDYTPVTYTLPMCYGVSDRAGLPPGADAKRQAQALQLQGYLLHFEQILADYLVQLGSVRDLFTFDASVMHTYNGRVLEDLRDLDKLIVEPRSTFAVRLRELLETPEAFAARRNRFLDHLLARFSEDLSDYERVSRWLTPRGVEARLLTDKINLLKDREYRAISTYRGQGYDPSQKNVWDTDNVSGTERRVSRLLGFARADRRTLTPSFLMTRPVMQTDPATDVASQKKNARGQALNVIVLLDPKDDARVLMTSVEVADGCCTDELMRLIVDRAAEPANFAGKRSQRPRMRGHAEGSDAFMFELWDGPDLEHATLLANSADFASAELRDEALRATEGAIEAIHRNEGFHLLEHILLRPRIDEVFDDADRPIDISLLDVCLDPCDMGIGIDTGAERPSYGKQVVRVPARLCFDKMPWILKYVRVEDLQDRNAASLLYQSVPIRNGSPDPLKFARYEALQRRVRDLQEFGSERVNYEVVSNEAENPADVRYGFVIHGRRKVALAQTLFAFKKQGSVPEGAAHPEDYVEHAIESWMRYFGFELDLYCEADPCDNDEDPYSLRATAVLPCWAGRLRDPTFRNLVEKTIETESPAHVHIRVVWVDIREMQRFEEAYYAWLEAMWRSQLPEYEFVNPLVDVLNTLRCCRPCEDECD